MYTLIEHKKLDAAAASITFSNIPQTFTDLYLVVSSRSNKTGDLDEYLKIAFNGLTTNLSSRALYGTGASAASNTVADQVRTIVNGPATASTFNSTAFYIPNYTTTASKSISLDSVGENNATTSYMGIAAGLWAGGSAVTSIQLTNVYGNFVQYSSATLYGVNRTSAIGAPKAIGGNITYSNGYWVHTFTGSGTFYAQQDLEIDALVVAGGGAGGSGSGGGGGGAGGYFLLSGRLLSTGSYPITVGSGGVGTNSNTVRGANGSSSSFVSLTAIGGGGGGAEYTQYDGAAGGSGGASAYNGTPGIGTSGQGNNGGDGAGSFYGGGGGGAGAAGSNATTSVAGAGGLGSVWNGSYYAGGGGGGSQLNNGPTSLAPGGLGGGGTGGTYLGTQATSGAANTGGGGGGGTAGGLAGSGGSGVVIVRYRAD